MSTKQTPKLLAPAAMHHRGATLARKLQTADSDQSLILDAFWRTLSANVAASHDFGSFLIDQMVPRVVVADGEQVTGSKLHTLVTSDSETDNPLFCANTDERAAYPSVNLFTRSLQLAQLNGAALFDTYRAQNPAPVANPDTSKRGATSPARMETFLKWLQVWSDPTSKHAGLFADTGKGKARTLVLLHESQWTGTTSRAARSTTTTTPAATTDAAPAAEVIEAATVARVTEREGTFADLFDMDAAALDAVVSAPDAIADVSAYTPEQLFGLARLFLAAALRAERAAAPVAPGKLTVAVK